MVEIMTEVKEHLDAPYRTVCHELNMPYSTAMRWKRRKKRAEPVVGKPGPAKTEPLDVARLHEDIRKLSFHRHRTGGTTALYGRYQQQISRRDLQALVAAAREEILKEQKALERRIHWDVPGMVWSMDDARNHALAQHPFGHIHLLQDLGSRYKLNVLGHDLMAQGERVAENLDSLFGQYGAPLFLKRDNGPNLNHHLVNAVLEDYGVIPLNSPPYYPPYNGGIEHAQREVRMELEARIGKEPAEPHIFRLQCELTGHALNHKKRRILNGKTSCRVLDDGRKTLALYTRPKRKEVYETIKGLTVDILDALDDHAHMVIETAFRYAAETWMQLNHIITITKNGAVLPPFYQIRTH